MTGIIPAYAGSTGSGRRRRPSYADHPRIRGEHFRAFRPDRPENGSSPHTRGARLLPGRSPGILRIIPAYAGSTATWRRTGRLRRDHPRIRGEHPLEIDSLSTEKGSSPHTRGALQLVDFRVVRAGIIPAYAGSTLEHHSASFTARDHPRIRGEHTTVYERTIEQEGSSPHTRGALPECVPDFGQERIIPAYAGSTLATTTPQQNLRDHPRIRGEHDVVVHDG